MLPSRRRSRALPALLTLAAAACAGGQRVAPESITGRRWLLVELGGAPVPASAEPSAPSFTLATDSTLTGQGGCNGFRGRWSFDDGRIATTGIAITRRACVEPERTERESRFVRLLEGRPRVTLTGDTLRLDADAGSARLVAAP